MSKDSWADWNSKNCGQAPHGAETQQVGAIWNKNKCLQECHRSIWNCSQGGSFLSRRRKWVSSCLSLSPEEGLQEANYLPPSLFATSFPLGSSSPFPLPQGHREHRAENSHSWRESLTRGSCGIANYFIIRHWINCLLKEKSQGMNFQEALVCLGYEESGSHCC